MIAMLDLYGQEVIVRGKCNCLFWEHLSFWMGYGYFKSYITELVQIKRDEYTTVFGYGLKILRTYGFLKIIILQSWEEEGASYVMVCASW